MFQDHPREEEALKRRVLKRGIEFLRALGAAATARSVGRSTSLGHFAAAAVGTSYRALDCDREIFAHSSRKRTEGINYAGYLRAIN